MLFIKKKKTCEVFGGELVNLFLMRANRSAEYIDACVFFTDEGDPISTGGKSAEIEFWLLLLNIHKLAVKLLCHKSNMQDRILRAFDSELVITLTDADIIEIRRIQYLDLFKRHYDSISRGDFRNFSAELSSMFINFCEGVPYDVDSPLVVDILKISYGSLANEMWSNIFKETRARLKKCELY